MAKISASDIKQIAAELMSHMDDAEALVEVAKQVITNMTAKLPSEKVAELLEIAGGWFKGSFSPIQAAMRTSEREWFNRKVEFIKKATQSSQLSEEAAVQLVAIHAKRWNDWMKFIRDGVKDNQSSDDSS